MRKLFGLLAVALLIGVVGAQASIVLDFAGLQNLEPIMNYYNGGLGGLGSGPGPNYGIVFGADSLSIISADKGGTGNYSLNPGVNIAFFLSGPGDIMDVAAGFDTGFSFYYSAYYAGSVDVYSGLDGGGSLLASLALPVTPGYCDPNHFYSCWVPIGVAFSGTAQSVLFTGSADYIAFADVTLGSENPGTPEPGTLILLGSGVLGLAGVIRRKTNL
jgi:hypothetical protein